MATSESSVLTGMRRGTDQHVLHYRQRRERAGQLEGPHEPGARDTLGVRPAIGWPPKRILPRSGARKPLTRSNTVVLPCAVRSDQRGDRSRGDLEARIAYRDDAAERALKRPSTRRSTASCRDGRVGRAAITPGHSVAAPEQALGPPHGEADEQQADEHEAQRADLRVRQRQAQAG